MPRYFFHIYDELELHDEEGLELADASDARRQAMAGVREMMCEEIKTGRLTLRHRVEVEDESGEEIFRLAFRDAVEIETT